MEGNFANEDHQAPGQASDDLIAQENARVEAQNAQEQEQAQVQAQEGDTSMAEDTEPTNLAQSDNKQPTQDESNTQPAPASDNPLDAPSAPQPETTEETAQPEDEEMTGTKDGTPAVQDATAATPAVVNKAVIEQSRAFD
jgi:hypothetical protein